MQVGEQEVEEIKDFISNLNSIKESVVIVEGKRDSAALRKIGFSGNILEFHKFGGLVNFVDSVARQKNIIILFDRDKKGRYLTSKTFQLLQRRTKLDLTFKHRLNKITKGKIRCVEQLVCYESFIN